MVAGSFFGMAGNAGRVVIDPANTGGTIVYAGGVDIDDTFAGNIDLLRASTTAEQVWQNKKALSVAKYLGLK